MAHGCTAMGYKALRVACNDSARRNASWSRLLAAGALALLASGCSLTMHLTSFNDEPETTASINPRAQATRLDPSLDDEDWRRAQAALSLAVDPQGPGLPVNWDNPSTKRRGSFAAAGDMLLVQDTICRPFSATLHQPGGKETRQSGQACRLGPSEWALRLDAPADKTRKDGADQPLPGKASAMMQARENTE